MKQNGKDQLPPRPGARPPRHQGGGASGGASRTRNSAATMTFTTAATSAAAATTTTTTTAPPAISNNNNGRSSRIPPRVLNLAPLPPLPARLAASSSTHERSRLLPHSAQPPPDNLLRRTSSFWAPRCCSISCISAAGAIIMSLVIFMGTYLASQADSSESLALDHWLFPNPHHPPPFYTFPDDFRWGVATSSYQIEGATAEDGRGASIWDVFCDQPGVIADASDGSVACDHYHRVVQDVQLMASLNIRAYRFSVAWPRILPNGTGAVNPKGVAFYNFLIDTLLRYEIEPWVTLFHWDLPQALMTPFHDDELGGGGWLNKNMSYAFAKYASICFDAFGDRVQHWITINEAWTVAVNGHATGIHAPGHQSLTEPYVVGHHLLLAHGLAVQAFREYQNRTNTANISSIGIANCGDFRYPTTVADNSTAQRVMLFQLGWMTDPVFFGDYPSVMRERLGDRLPTFSAQERQLLMGSADFVGLNYYSSMQASALTAPPLYPGYWTWDIGAHLHTHPDWRLNDMGWAVVPDGLRNMLLWISQRYDNPLVYITENGDAEHGDVVKPLLDLNRLDYVQGHLRAAGQALEKGVNLGGYFCWSFSDNFEWSFGYTKKFGLVRVEFADGSLKRTPKVSAYWYNETIANHGRNIPRASPLSWFPSV